MTHLKRKQSLQLRNEWELPYNSLMKFNITHVAKLANLPLSDDEKKLLEPQLTDVITYVEKLQNVNTQNVERTSQVTGLETVLRDDNVDGSLSQETALSQAPSVQNEMFQVKGIFEE